MQPIKAFVAHSFTEDDKKVVEVILGYLDTVSQIHPRFTWDHAKSPEPEVIDAKVLSLLADKNLLIAICTRKERAIQSSAVSTRFYLPNSLLVGAARDFEWKTSDWIIQEIGLAIGRSMKIILLVEVDTRSPGALQGNLERIDFDRAAPEQCFDKLLGMIAALSPHVEGGQATAAKDADPQTADKIGAKRPPDLGDGSTPKPDWKKEDYKLALMRYSRY